MQNLRQTQIFYKVGQTRLTREKCDPVDPNDPDDPTQLQRCYIYCYCLFAHDCKWLHPQNE